MQSSADPQTGTKVTLLQLKVCVDIIYYGVSVLCNIIILLYNVSCTCLCTYIYTIIDFEYQAVYYNIISHIILIDKLEQHVQLTP